MKILWVSNAPTTPGGYGTQTAIATRQIRELGHDIEILAFNLGTSSTLISDDWNGIKIHPGGNKVYANGLVNPVARKIGADLIIVFGDVWVHNPAQFEGSNVAVWAPIDTDPLGGMDNFWLKACNARQLHFIAMSKHGLNTVAAAGYEPLYVPHVVDIGVFCPAPDRAALRAAQGIPADAFIVSMTSENRGPRKSFPQQFEGFRDFRRKYPNSYLRCHTDPRHEEEGGVAQAMAILHVAHSLGIDDAVEFPDHFRYETSDYPPSYLAELYQSADVHLQCSRAEGFGIPIIEAQACGTPVITTDWSAMTELVPPQAGWRVGGIRDWHDGHRSWWLIPDPRQITDALVRAKKETSAAMRRACTKHVVQNYSIEQNYDRWNTALAAIEWSITS